MALDTIKKISLHLGLTLAACALARLYSPMGRVHAGWLAAAFGSIYLLAAWTVRLKSRGTDLLSFFKKKGAREVPYYLRGADKRGESRLTAMRGLTHRFGDSLESETEEERTRSPQEAAKIKSVAYAFVGAALLILSAFS